MDDIDFATAMKYYYSIQRIYMEVILCLLNR